MTFVRPFEDRFWEKVDIRGDGECWNWKANVVGGYGQIKVDRYRSVMAHRASFELSNEKIPEGMCVMHSCDNPLCVNPAHLSLGTVADNNADCRRKGRHKCGRSTGEDHPKAKLTWADVEEIRASKIMQKDLAVRFGVERSVISRICGHKSWVR